MAHRSKLPTSLLLLSSMLFILSCQQRSTPTEDQEIYFNLTELIQQQAVLLDSLQPKVTKRIQSSKKQETKDVEIDHWEKELYLFKNVDINKTAYAGMYKKTSTSSGESSQERYEATSTSLSTKSLTIDRSGESIRTITIQVNQENLLYSSQKTLLLTFTRLPEAGLCINTYDVQGKQSSLFGLGTTYHVTGEIMLEK